jgi:membrane fusion protein, multidrug efflux system
MKASNSERMCQAWAAPFVVCMLVLASACTRQASPQPDLARPVKTMVVAAGEGLHVRSFPGKAEASKKAELAFQVSGLLVKLPIKEGQNVAKGELIAQLRQDEFEARLKSLQGQLDQARATLRALQAGDRPEQRLRLEAQVRAAAAQLANARTENNRAQQLIRSNAISRADADRARTTYQVAQEDHKAALQMLEKGTIAREEDIEAQEGVVRGLEGAVVEANIQLADCTLRAPYDGVIAKRFVEPNQNVKATEPVVKFQDVDEIDVAVDVPESVMAFDLRSADIVELVAEFSAVPGLRFPVQIKEVAQRADPITQTFRVRVTMKAPPDNQVLPGMTATITATFRRATILGSRILVPISAVFKEDSGGQVAWIIGTDGKVSRRPVKTGAPSGGQLEILEGLEPGDRIAIAGVPFLREGMKVRELGDALGGV